VVSSFLTPCSSVKTRLDGEAKVRDGSAFGRESKFGISRQVTG
jgi:hypothetical protein